MTNPLRIIHVDDDPESLEAFRMLVSEIPAIIYLNGFTDPKLAVHYVHENAVDLVVLDVEMGSEDGFWFADQVKHLPVDIVFLSAHATFALQAFEACAIDFMVKPATVRTVSEFLARYRLRQGRQQLQHARIAEAYERYLPASPDKAPKRIFIHSVGEIIVVLLEEVLYFSAAQNYTHIFLTDGRKCTASKQLRTYEEALAHHPDFLRVHRSYIVNRNFVKSIQTDSRRHHASLTMSDGSELEISFQKKDEIIRMLTE